MKIFHWPCPHFCLPLNFSFVCVDIYQPQLLGKRRIPQKSTNFHYPHLKKRWFFRKKKSVANVIWDFKENNFPSSFINISRNIRWLSEINVKSFFEANHQYSMSSATYDRNESSIFLNLFLFQSFLIFRSSL